MGQVVKLSDYRPHVTIDTLRFDGKINVCPFEWLRAYAGGEPVEPPTEAEMRVIVGEWLLCLELGYVEKAVDFFTDGGGEAA